eukprot:TRINITY_DN11638_c0_g1_i4.p1 TRINITY_DN11638_c0_g1~~TRINITY_DN11638_c0_g1_i4.p1  ORF type:complete len:2405 (-),score=346.14 TRINITY_DN11638_c0_g1_i4:51-7265(-)
MTTKMARRKAALSCKLYGHYDWTPGVVGDAVATSMTIEVRDNTCWTSLKASFMDSTVQKGKTTEAACRAACRKEVTCSHFRMDGSKCTFMGSKCMHGRSPCKFINVKAQEKIPQCGERNTCVRVTHPSHWYVSGEFCPIGDNGALGPVYQKTGYTPEDMFYLAAYDRARDGSIKGCGDGMWVVKAPQPKLDFQDVEAGYVELHGRTIVCLAAGKDFLTQVFNYGHQAVDVKGGFLSTSVSAEVAGLGCGPPNTTHEKNEEEEEEEEEEQLLSPIILDDPTTFAPADFWLHPCECAPTSWGGKDPVSQESVTDVPAGSGNKFSPARFEIVAGEFVCEQEALLPGLRGVHLESEGESQDPAGCETRCREDSGCNFFWAGEVKSTKQCRMYSKCTVLVREVGTNGALVALPPPSVKMCRIANPEVCWKVTKRRNFLGAGTGSIRPQFLCKWEGLLRQCDHKLLLGGVGVEKCGRCTYADIDSHQWAHKMPVPKRFEHGQHMLAKCWSERFAPVPVGVGKLEHETLSCISGKWVGSGGHLGLAGFACGAYVQLTRQPYRELDLQEKQELYFASMKEVQILVDTKMKLQLSKDGNLKKTQITPWNIVGSFRLRNLASVSLCLSQESSRNINAKMIKCNDGNLMKWYWNGERIKTIVSRRASSTDKCMEMSGNDVRVATCRPRRNQKWYWNGNTIKSRASPTRCLHYNAKSSNVEMNTCDSKSTHQGWYQEDMSPLRMTEPNTLLLSQPAVAGAVNGTDMIYDVLDTMDDADAHDLEESDAAGEESSDGQEKKEAEQDAYDVDVEDGNLTLEGSHSNDTTSNYDSNSSDFELDDLEGDEHTSPDDSVDQVSDADSDESDSENASSADLSTSNMTLDMSDEALEGHAASSFAGEARSVRRRRVLSRIKTVHDHSKTCIQSTGGHSYMEGCSGSSAQQYRWDGNTQRIKSDRYNKCFDYDPRSHWPHRVKLWACHNGNNQKWYWDWTSRRLKSRHNGQCLDFNPSERRRAHLKVYHCHNGHNQKFYFDQQDCVASVGGWGVCSKSCGGGVQHRTVNVLAHPRHGGNGCPSNSQSCNTHACPTSAGDRRRRRLAGHMKSYHNHNYCADIHMGNYLAQMHGHCHGGNNQMWYWEGDRVKSKFGYRCLDYNPGERRRARVKSWGCHNGNNQKWYWDTAKRLHSKHDHHQCLDWWPGPNPLVMHPCHNGNNQKFYLTNQDCVAQPGGWGKCSKTCGGGKRSRHVRVLQPARGGGRACPPTSESCNTHHCPINCAGKWGPWGSCSKTCGGGTKVRSYIITRHPKYGGARCPQTHGRRATEPCRTQPCPGRSEGGFVAENVPMVADEIKRFESAEALGTCLQGDARRSITSSRCSTSKTQLMDAAAISGLLWEKFVDRSAHLVPADVSTRVHGRRRRHRTVYLNDFRFRIDCKDHVMNSFSFNAQGSLGMSSSCAAAATVGNPTPFKASCRGGDAWQTRFDGFCMTYDTENNNNVNLQKCNQELTQRWFWQGDYLKNEANPSKCLDYNYGNNNVYMHPCHNGNNQKFYWNGERVRERHHHKCLDYHVGHRNTIMHPCHGGMNQKWFMATGINRMARNPIECPPGTVLSYFHKGGDVIDYRCSIVANLGACTPGQSPQVDTASETLVSLKTLSVTCGNSHALQSLLPEASDGGEWLRFRFSCCSLGGVPTSIVPTTNLVGIAMKDWEGVYAPVSRDASGRMLFQQQSAFKFGAGLAGELKFNKETGKWCVGKDCSALAVAHPLDEPLQGKEWVAVAVTDFDGEFEAKGVTKAEKSGGSKKPPKLIEFGATQPEYAEECKDDVTPGTKYFDAEKQFEVSSGLKPENPCAFVGGKIKEDGTGEGDFWTENDLSGNVQMGASDTYEHTIECANREISRDLFMAKQSDIHAKVDMAKNTVLTTAESICEFIPNMETAPMGLGLEFQPGNICKGIVGLADSIWSGANDLVMTKHEENFANADNGDCNSQQHGLARIFCDLHCIRDAVRTGDAAILKSLEDAVAIVGQNTQLLLEHFTGLVTDKIDDLSDQVKESQKSTMLQVSGMRGRLGAMFTEMKGFVSERALNLAGSVTMGRALGSFTTALQSLPPVGQKNATLEDELALLESRAGSLHATLKHASMSHASTAFKTEERVAAYASKMTDLLRSQTSMLGVYEQSASNSKRLQTWLRSHWQPGADALMQELQHQETRALLSELDVSWWSLRGELDKYLDAAQQQVAAYRGAVGALDEYTSQCSLGFSALQSSYSKVAAAEKHAHGVLRTTWSAAVPLVGLLASKLSDADGLSTLARSDAASVDATSLDRSTVSLLCSSNAQSRSDGETAVQALVKQAVQKGLFGQTLRQLRVAFVEMVMLRDRHFFGGLGNPPESATVAAAWRRVDDAEKKVHEQQALVDGEITRRIRNVVC